MIDKKLMRMPMAWWKGQKVVSTEEIGNRLGTLPKGTIFVVRKKYGTLSLESMPCSCCGLKVHITKVAFHSVEMYVEPEKVNGKGGENPTC